MKIWRISCALAAILLLTQAQAQRRGSRRYDVTQVSDLSAEEDEEGEPSLETPHRFKGRRRSSYFESNGKLQNIASSTLHDDFLQESTTEYTRIGSKPKKDSARNSNFRHANRQLNFASQSEPGDVLIDSERNSGRQSYTRSRERSNRNDRNNQFSPQTEAPMSESISFLSRKDRITGRENKIRQTTQDHRSNISNERKSLFSVSSMQPEEVMPTGKSRFREKIPSEEMSTHRGRKRNDDRKVKQRIPDQERDSIRTFSSRTADTSSTQRPTRTKDTILENNTQTQRSSRRQNNVPSNRSTPNNNIEIPKQDVETRISNRRRVFENERRNPIPVHETDLVQTKSSFSTDKLNKEEKSSLQSGSNTPVKFTSDILESQTFENGLIPSSNGFPNFTEEHLELENPKYEIPTQVTTVSAINSKEDTSNKALHTRSRGRGSFGSQFSKRERTKTVPNEKEERTKTQRRSKPETETAFPSQEMGFAQRGKQMPRGRTEENITEEIRISRTRPNNNQPLSRVSSKDGIDQHDVKDRQKIKRRQGSYETKTEAYATDSQTNISENISSGRKTLSQRSRELDPSTNLSRGRGHYRQGVGSQNENEKSSGREKDEEVSDDDNYPDVYKQLKKAGSGPKEILALLKARKKQREAQEAQQEVQQRQKSLDPTTSRVNQFSDLKTEEDNVKPSIESLPRKNKSNRKYQTEVEEETISNKPLRSSNRHQRVLNHNLFNENNQLKQVNQEKPTNQFGPRYNRKKPEEDKNKIFENKKYSAKLLATHFDTEQDLETKLEKPFQKENNIHKTLNALGLDPNTLETTEPVTERERFIPSSRRTKPYGQSTEGLYVVDDQSSSTFKPRYQLYEAKNRKTLLDNRFRGAKDVSGNSKQTEENKSVKEDSIGRVTKPLRTTTTIRPSYTPRKPASSRYTGRLKNKHSSVYHSSPLNQAVLEPQPNDQEPVTVHFFEVEGKAPKLESASLVTEESPITTNLTHTIAVTSEETPATTVSAENTTTIYTNATSTTSSTEPFLNNFVIDDKPVNIPSLPSTVPTTVSLPSTTQAQKTTTQLPTTNQTPTQIPTTKQTTQQPTTQQPITHKIQELVFTLPTTTQLISTTTNQQLTNTTQKPIRPSTQQTTNTIKQQTISKAPHKPTSKPTQNPKTTTTLKDAKTTKPTQKPLNITKTQSTTKPPSTIPKSTTKIIQTTSTTKIPTTTIKSIGTTNKKPIPTTKPTVTTTKKINTTNQPTAPKSPQTQSPLLPFTKMTPTEASSATIYDQLVAKSNFVERSEFSTLPQIIMTTSQSLQSSSFGNVLQSNEVPNNQNTADYVAYALLPNNTLVRRVSPRSTIPPTEIPFVVYGLYPNGTIVKRYPNGTVVPDDPSPDTNELVGEVDPLNKQGLSDILERDRSLAYLYPSTTTSAKNMASIFSLSSEAPSSGTLSTTEVPFSTLTTTLNPSTTTTTTMMPTTITTTITPTTTTSTMKPTTTQTTTNKPSTTTTFKPTTTKQTTTTTKLTSEKSTTTTPKLATTTPQYIVSTTQKETTTIKPRAIITVPTNPAPPKTTTAQEPLSTTTTTSSTPRTTLTPTTTAIKVSTVTNKSTTIKLTTPTTTSTTNKPTTTTSTTTTTHKPLKKLAEETTESSSEPITSTSGLSKDEFALLNSLLSLQSEGSNSITPSESSSPPLTPTGPDDDDLANRIIQLAIERSQSPSVSSAEIEDSENSVQLSSSSEPGFEREGKSIAPPLVDSMAVETSSQGGKISLWVVPESETATEQTTKPQKLTPEEEQVLTALLAAPQPTNSISLRDQLLLAELLAAGKNGASEEGSISTTKRPRKKKKPKTTTSSTPPALSPLSALFGGGGRGGGLLGSGAVPAATDGEEEDYERPQGGLLVNAAINITRAVSQFMGLVLQGAAQSFQGFLASRTRNFADYFVRGGGIS